ncbi:MAG: ATP-binding cassette domain-containing protein [Theionarchaea archaeon]|nr:ATP-binding cassette domain-containing protein [Theionarchaea archaeon]
MAAIKCESLTKTFKNTTVLHDINLEVEENTHFGLLGPDGSGKTTLLRLLTGLCKPTSGSCSLFNEDARNPETALQQTGCLVGEPAFYEDFTVEELLHLFANLTKSEIDIESTGITFKNEKGKNLTPAMKKHLGIAIALLGDPRLLLLDEPLTGLDGRTRTKMKTVLKSKETLFFTTNNPRDIEELATEAAIIQKGEITHQGAVSKLPLHDLEVEP